ncbi:MAG: radical SAM protein [bacterium]
MDPQDQVSPIQLRPYTIEEFVQTVCPQCFAERQRASDEPGVWKDGMLVSHSGSIWMRRFCELHGETESLYEEDALLWQARRGWSTPTSTIVPDRPGLPGGFPDAYRHGLPASHAQHTCILLLNVTERCNYGCPACFASAKPPGTAEPIEERPTLTEILATVDTMLEREGGRLGVVMLSGGEPTVRRDIVPMIEALATRSITRIMLNSNGREIARNDALLDFLATHRRQVEVYLQFDGFDGNTSHVLRNEDVLEEKLLASARMNERGIFHTLVTTVMRNVNEEQCGRIIRHGLDSPYCSGVALQPMFGSGRFPGYDPLDRTTPTGILKRLAGWTDGAMTAEDFVPLPCSHRDCCDISYMLKLSDGSWKSLPQLIGRDRLREWIHIVANTITFDGLSRPVVDMLRSGSLTKVLSEQLGPGAPQLALEVSRMCACVPGLFEKLGGIWQRLGGRSGGERPDGNELATRGFRITIKQFMDAHTFNSARIRQCCVHTGSFEEDPRRLSFCWRWLFDDASDFPDGRPRYRRDGTTLEIGNGDA